jgi:hypothetical protein
MLFLTLIDRYRFSGTKRRSTSKIATLTHFLLFSSQHARNVLFPMLHCGSYATTGGSKAQCCYGVLSSNGLLNTIDKLRQQQLGQTGTAPDAEILPLIVIGAFI